jgi:glycosyltransferase involved in cell wall biosynthesis
MHICRYCFVNLGLYRSGITTLAQAANDLNLHVSQSFPLLDSNTHQKLLEEPRAGVHEWYNSSGQKELLKLIQNNNLICDGWVPLLAFLDNEVLESLQQMAFERDVEVFFFATTRDVEESVHSELHHWVRHDLERRAGLSNLQRAALDDKLRKRAQMHKSRIQDLHGSGILKAILPLDSFREWPLILSNLLIPATSPERWEKAFNKVGRQNSNPKAPLEGILLTMRINELSVAATKALLDDIEKDHLCRYMVVLGIDREQVRTDEAETLIDSIRKRPRIEKCTVVENPSSKPDSPFRICDAWNCMAIQAWKDGADWVMLHGDDIQIHTPYHYREIYRSFLDIQDRLGCPFGFGCPWWHDTTFPGFPTFPVVGREHYQIFGSLIPKHRADIFVNQDLDPYVQRLYLKFGAAPLLNASLTNLTGGNETNIARYDRIPAIDWKEWVLDDVDSIETYLSEQGRPRSEIYLLDVIVPTNRLNVDYLLRICSLQVPENMRTTFIVIVDNPTQLIKTVGNGTMTSKQAALELERRLVEACHVHNNIRVRCNPVNLGASASRNLGLDESSAEYVLFLDDDVKPSDDLLLRYSQAIPTLTNDQVGLVGMVRFPRSPSLPLKHAAILISYLTFMFEIAGNDMYKYPAWGVTANLLVKRTKIRFDTNYAKTGGGEDVDFCLRVSEQTGMSFQTCPLAMVGHDFWSGSIFDLCKHFFNWAIGDSALFSRFPEHTYRSYPNAVEAYILLFPVQMACQAKLIWILMTPVLFLFADVAVEMLNRLEMDHRCQLLESKRSLSFLIAAHVLANVYVLVLECGRLLGHLSRRQFRNVCWRFDWHCARLLKARENFVARERHKFFLFCCIALSSLLWKT